MAAAQTAPAFPPQSAQGMGSREQEGSEVSFSTTAFAKTEPGFLLQWHIQKVFDLSEEGEGDLSSLPSIANPVGL